MTTLRAYGTDFAFLDWMRRHERLDSKIDRFVVSDFDVLIHQYRDRSAPNEKRFDNMMVLETKTHCLGPAYQRAEPRRSAREFAQLDTWRIWNSLVAARIGDAGRRRCRTHHVRLTSDGELRRVRFWGLHAVALSGDRPENGVIWWNRRREPISVEWLVQLLRFERHPFQPDRMVDYRNHHDGEVGIMPIIDLCRAEVQPCASGS